MDDDERRSRLDAVQMADLGSARREYISTVDIGNKHRKVSLRQIEAAREANKKGSQENRIAEANKDQLNKWSNAWKDLGQDVELENLDSLLNGQSHRIQLSQTVKGYSGHPYGGGRGASNSEHMHYRNGSAGISSRGGRGGAHFAHGGRNPSIGRAPSSRRGDDGFDESKLLAKPQDPSRDCNNRDSQPRGGNIKRRGGSSRGQDRKPPLVKRRVVPPTTTGGSFESMLANSATFMQAISHLVPTGASTNSAPASEAAASDDESGQSKRNTSTDGVNRAGAVVGPEVDAPATYLDPQTTPHLPKVPQQAVQSVSQPASLSPKEHDEAQQPLPHAMLECSTPPMSAVYICSTPSTSGSEPATISRKGGSFSSALPQPPRFISLPSDFDTLDIAKPANCDQEPLAATSKIEQELEDISKLLSNVRMLPSDAVRYLQMRKFTLEGQLPNSRSESGTQIEIEDHACQPQNPTEAPKVHDRGSASIKTKTQNEPAQNLSGLPNCHELGGMTLKVKNHGSPMQMVFGSPEAEENVPMEIDSEGTQTQTRMSSGFPQQWHESTVPNEGQPPKAAFGPSNDQVGLLHDYAIPDAGGNIIGSYLLPGRLGERQPDQTHDCQPSVEERTIFQQTKAEVPSTLTIPRTREVETEKPNTVSAPPEVTPKSEIVFKSKFPMTAATAQYFRGANPDAVAYAPKVENKNSVAASPAPKLHEIISARLRALDPVRASMDGDIVMTDPTPTRSPVKPKPAPPCPTSRPRIGQQLEVSISMIGKQFARGNFGQQTQPITQIRDQTPIKNNHTTFTSLSNMGVSTSVPPTTRTATQRQPQPQNAQTRTFSPSAAPLNPPKHPHKENNQPRPAASQSNAAAFQARAEVQGLSVKRGNGCSLSASKHAN